MINGLRSGTRRPRGRHVDTEVQRRAGLSFVLLVAPWVAVAVVLIWSVPEDFSRTPPAVWAVAALFFALLWGGERLIVRRTRPRRDGE